LDLSANAGFTSATLDSPVAMADGASFNVKSTAATQAALTLTKVTGTAGDATSTFNLNGPSNVTLNGVGTDITLDVTSTSSTGLTLNSNSSANTVVLTNTGAALTSLTVTGNVVMTLTESLAAIRTVNASAATASLLLDVSGATMNSAFAFTGGSGNDRLTFAAAQTTATTGLSSGANIDFGTGTDTLVIKDTTPVYATINAMKGLEILGVGVTAATVDMSSLTASTVQTIGAIAASTVTNLESTDTVIIGGAMGTSMTMSGVLGNNTANLQIGEAASTANGITGTGGMTVASLVLTGLTNINLSSVGTNAAANIFTAMTTSDNSLFTITGSNDLTMAISAGTALGSRISASAMTGKLVVTGSAQADVIVGGSGADTINSALGGVVTRADTLTGGAGADIFSFKITGTNNQANDNVTLYTVSSGTTAVTKITDFVAGTDKIHLEIDNTAGTLVAGTSMVLATAQTIATASSLTAVYAGITAIGASTNGGALSGVVVTVSGGSAAGTYLYVNDAAGAGVSNSADMLINLTGLTGTLSAGDFTFA